MLVSKQCEIFNAYTSKQYFRLCKKDIKKDIYSDASSITESSQGEIKHRSYRVNIRRLCMIITHSAKSYYDKNKEKFDFFNYKILDWDKEIAVLKHKA